MNFFYFLRIFDLFLNYSFLFYLFMKCFEEIDEWVRILEILGRVFIIMKVFFSVLLIRNVLGDIFFMINLGVF